MTELQAPFPWFGGKRRVAPEVWQRFGDVANYIEPFFGSGAVLLGRPTEPKTETVNDMDGFVVNFWRAIKSAPEEVAIHADNPVFENDLHARHSWLVNHRGELACRLEGDPYWFDAKIAGWWVWGLCCWIGGGFCSGNGPWVVDDDRRLVRLGDNGRGVNRKRVHIESWFYVLSERLRNVRVCSGDWSRVCGPSVTHKHGLTGVFLDPPYSEDSNREKDLYREDSLSVAHDVRRWAIENGDNKLMRIALCGYDGEHSMPESWTVHEWSAPGGYEGQAKEQSGNRHRERIWFSPHCLSNRQGRLF